MLTAHDATGDADTASPAPTRGRLVDVSLNGRSFKSALGESLFREQYLDAVAAVINAQEAAGLDIVTDATAGSISRSRKSWFFYPIERLGGIDGHRSTSRGWMGRHDLRPGQILWEVQEAYQPSVVRKADARTVGIRRAMAGGAAPDRQAGQVRCDCAPALASMLWNESYADDKAMILDLCDIMNADCANWPPPAVR